MPVLLVMAVAVFFMIVTVAIWVLEAGVGRLLCSSSC